MKNLSTVVKEEFAAASVASMPNVGAVTMQNTIPGASKCDCDIENCNCNKNAIGTATQHPAATIAV